MRPHAAALVLLLAAELAAAAPAGSRAAPPPLPAWASAAIADTSTFGAGADAVVLLDSLEVRVGRDGRVTRHGRRVVRVLAPAGRKHASCAVYYIEGPGKPPELAATWVPAGGAGAPKAVGPVVDMVAGGIQVRSEVRCRVLAPGEPPGVGDVFVADWTHEDAPPFLDFDFDADLGLPVRRSGFRLDWPAEWPLASRWLPDGAPDSTSGSGSRTWSFTRIGAPGAGAGVAGEPPRRIALSFRPDRPIRARCFADWASVSGWVCELARGQDSGPAIDARARAAVAGRTDEFDRLRALAAPPQSARYVALQIGIGRGGGYRPRAAQEVLDLGYGDCKDKANLFCALARAAGYRAWLVPVYSGNRHYVCADWPSPQQFNHCIAAVALGGATGAAAGMEHARLGPLLFFDATDPDTPLGELPEGLQGSLALLADGDRGELVRLPDAPAERNRATWELRGSLSASGSANGELALEATGTAAANHRALLRALGESGYASAFARRFARQAAGVSVAGFSPGASAAPEATRAAGRWSAAALGRPLSGGSLVFGLPVVGERPGAGDVDGLVRSGLEARTDREVVRLRMPDGFRLAVAPADTVLATPFGRFERRTRVAGDTLLVERAWTSARRAVSAAAVDSLRAALRRLDGEDRAMWRLSPVAATP